MSSWIVGYKDMLGARGVYPNVPVIGICAWDFLDTRLQAFKKMQRDEIMPPNIAASAWRKFMKQEIRIQEQTLQLARSVREGISLSGRPADQACLRASVTGKVMQWMQGTELSRDEMCVPVLFASPTDGNHVIYVGIRKSVASDDVQFRIDDSSPHEGQCQRPESRARDFISPFEFRIPRRALKTQAIKNDLNHFLASPQASFADFRAWASGLAQDEIWIAQGLTLVSPQAQLMSVSAQQGNYCVVKNHNRGIAARIQDSLSQFVQENRRLVAADGRRAWRWLKDRERNIACAEMATH